MVQVSSIRKNIAGSQNVAEEALKLIFKGKVLGDDTATAETLGMKDNDFMVLMVGKACFVFLPRFINQFSDCCEACP